MAKARGSSEKICHKEKKEKAKGAEKRGWGKSDQKESRAVGCERGQRDGNRE